MTLTVVINTIFAFAFIICLLCCIGDVDTVMASTSLPILTVFYSATISVPATNAFMTFIIIVSIVGDFGVFASVSRLTWAFARDRGLPFADFFAYVGHHESNSSRLPCPNTILGASYAKDPRKRALSRRCTLGAFGSHQYCVDDGLLRLHISNHSSTLHLVPPPNHLSPDSETQGSVRAVSTLEPRWFWHSHQHLRNLLCDIYDYLAPVPDIAPCHKGHNELRCTSLDRTLVSLLQQSPCSRIQRKSLPASCILSPILT